MAPPLRTSSSRIESVLLLVLGLVCAWLFSFGVREPGEAWFSRAPSGYYGLLTAGFRDGHLYVRLPPHPGLLALADPYDPAANAPYRVHDMTFYGGRYYLYFGATPALIFFWPVVAVSGWYPTEPCAAVCFCFAGVVAGLAFLRAVRRRHFPDAPSWSLVLAALCLALAGPILGLTLGANFYKVPIACAFCLSMMMLGALYRALHAERGQAAWMAGASLLFGLAVGARPDYLASGVGLLRPGLWLAGVGGGRLRAGVREALTADQRRARRQLILAMVMPAALCGLGLALYNWLRFGSVAEFGMHYQLAGGDQRNLRLMGLDHFGANAFAYLFGPGHWQRYFPFFSPPGGGPYGLLRYAPWCWLAPLAFLPTRGGDPRARLLAATVLGVASANFILLSSYMVITDRYVSDFAPAWLLLSGFGALALGSVLAGRPWLRRLTALGLTAAAAISVVIALSVFATAIPRPGLLAPLARWADWPASRWERAHGTQYGALQLELELPATRPDDLTEPIFETGSAESRRDWLQITYLPDNRAQLAFFHAGLGFVKEGPSTCPPSRRISITARCGSLLPPFAHPCFTGWTPEAYELASRDLQLSVNGEEVLSSTLACYPSSPEDLRIGTRGWNGDGIAARFSGQILSCQRLPLEQPAPVAVLLHGHAPIKLTVVFPADQSSGQEPLVSTGQGQESDLLYCIYDGPGRIHYALDHRDSGGPQGGAVAYEATRSSVLEIWMGSVAEPGPKAREQVLVPPERRVVVWLDGAMALNEIASWSVRPPPGNDRLWPAIPSRRRKWRRVLRAGCCRLDNPPISRPCRPCGRRADTGASTCRSGFPRGFWAPPNPSW